MKSITLREDKNPCAKCGGRMIIKGHKLEDKKIFRQKQYYTQWSYCLKCKTQWMSPEFCVINKNTFDKMMEHADRVAEHAWKEEMDSLFKIISGK
jgi:tRNA U54 and U55 pseudouridine synthase Pus10